MSKIITQTELNRKLSASIDLGMGGGYCPTYSELISNWRNKILLKDLDGNYSNSFHIELDKYINILRTDGLISDTNWGVVIELGESWITVNPGCGSGGSVSSLLIKVSHNNESKVRHGLIAFSSRSDTALITITQSA